MVYAKKKKAKKRTRDELEAQPAEDIVGFVDQGVNAVVAQWKPIAIVLGASAVILGGLSIYDLVQAGREDTAAGLLYDAEMKLPEPAGFSFDLTGAPAAPEDRDEDLRAAADQFASVAEEYGSTVSGDMARIEAGHTLLQLGEYEQAAERYGEAAGSRSRMVKTLALNGKATALESLERFEDEQAVLRELMGVGAGPVVEYAYMDLIRAHELAGDADGALAVCREFEEKLPDSPLITEVQGKIRTLGGSPDEEATTTEEGAQEGTS